MTRRTASSRSAAAATLEDAFIGYLEDAEAQKRAAESATAGQETVSAETSAPAQPAAAAASTWFSVQRMLSYTHRETLELSRDPIRLTMAGLGSVILMIIMGYGITLDVEHLNYAVLDRDQSTISQDYNLDIAGSSRYFTQRPPVADYGELDRRMKSGELSMVVEFPDFGRDVERWAPGKKPVLISAWIDGAMPQRAETIRGYVQGMHLLWLQKVMRERLGLRRQLGVGQRQLVVPATIELRYRYNPDVKSLPAMVPAVIPLLLLLIPAMLATLSVVRRKGLGVDYQLLRHADDTTGISLGQAARVRDPGDAQFPAARRAGSNPLPGAAEREFWNRGRRRTALRHLLHGDWVIRLHFDAHPEWRHCSRRLCSH